MSGSDILYYAYSCGPNLSEGSNTSSPLYNTGNLCKSDSKSSKELIL